MLENAMWGSDGRSLFWDFVPGVWDVAHDESRQLVDNIILQTQVEDTRRLKGQLQRDFRAKVHRWMFNTVDDKIFFTLNMQTSALLWKLLYFTKAFIRQISGRTLQTIPGGYHDSEETTVSARVVVQGIDFAWSQASLSSRMTNQPATEWKLSVIGIRGLCLKQAGDTVHGVVLWIFAI